MKKFTTKKIVLSAFFIALGYVLPFLTAHVQTIGRMLLPMHIPVLLCGYIVGAPYGLIVGLIVPLLKSMSGMPPLIPTALAMSFELAAYGLFAGLLYKHLPKKNIYIYINLIITMILGRVVWGIASVAIYGFAGNPFTWQLFFAGAFINALPGIILQIILIPVIIMALKKAGLISNE